VIRATLSGLALAVLVAGCSTQPMRKVTVDSARLQGGVVKDTLRCPYRLKDVVDARPSGTAAGGAGGVGLTAYSIADPAGIVRDQLHAMGLVETAEGPELSVRLMQLYVGNTNGTKVPVAVYEWTLAGHAPAIIRSQPASMNWWGSDDEMTGALAIALREANRRLVSELNATCPATPASAS
jgi:hypothetical protein